MISEIARVRHEKRDDEDTKGGRDIKKRKIKGVGQGVRRTGPTAQEQPHSRGFLQDRQPAQHPLWNILLRSHATMARFVLKIIPITSTLRGNYFRRTATAHLQREIGACQFQGYVALVQWERNRTSWSACVQHASACSCVIVRTVL